MAADIFRREHNSPPTPADEALALRGRPAVAPPSTPKAFATRRSDEYFSRLALAHRATRAIRYPKPLASLPLQRAAADLCVGRPTPLRICAAPYHRASAHRR